MRRETSTFKQEFIMANEGVIPTLDINQPVITNKSDKMTYLLKFLMYNPGWVSSWYDNHLLSMRQSMAANTEDRNKLVPALQQYLNQVIHNFYPDYSCTLETHDHNNDPLVYDIDIYIRDGLGNIVIQLDRLRKDKSGLFILKNVASV